MAATLVLGSAVKSSSRYLMYRVLGHLLLMLSAVKLVAMAVSILYNESSFWVFLGSGLFTAAVGYSLVYKGREAKDIKHRQLFLLTTLSWLALCVFSAIPLWLIVPNCTLTDAVF